MHLCVVDLVINGNNVNMILGLKKQLVDIFEMGNLGILHLFLGIQELQMDDNISNSQPNM